jgi:hypothetical protein
MGPRFRGGDRKILMTSSHTSHSTEVAYPQVSRRLESPHKRNVKMVTDSGA